MISNAVVITELSSEDFSALSSESESLGGFCSSDVGAGASIICVSGALDVSSVGSSINFDDSLVPLGSVGFEGSVEPPDSVGFGVSVGTVFAGCSVVVDG